MLDHGKKLFDQYASKAREAGSNELHGCEMWRLYDAFGFPVDLTRLMVEELAMTINEKERKDKVLKLHMHPAQYINRVHTSMWYLKSHVV